MRTTLLCLLLLSKWITFVHTSLSLAIAHHQFAFSTHSKPEISSDPEITFDEVNQTSKDESTGDGVLYHGSFDIKQDHFHVNYSHLPDLLDKVKVGLRTKDNVHVINIPDDITHVQFDSELVFVYANYTNTCIAIKNAVNLKKIKLQFLIKAGKNVIFKHGKTFEIEHECNICLQPLVNNKTSSTKTFAFSHCGHSFHKHCLLSWYDVMHKQKSDATCPLCRGLIERYKPDVPTNTRTFSGFPMAPFTRSPGVIRAFFSRNVSFYWND
eukprot:921134_1